MLERYIVAVAMANATARRYRVKVVAALGAGLVFILGWATARVDLRPLGLPPLAQVEILAPYVTTPRRCPVRAPCGPPEPALFELRALYDQGPSVGRLARTRTGRADPEAHGLVIIAFCVAHTGKVESTRVIKRFPGDREVDRIVREAVRKWRFKPAGRMLRATVCAEASFEITFSPHPARRWS
jgi:TonB family protein